MFFNEQCELIVISSVFSSEDNYEKVMTMVEENDFFEQKNQKIYSILSSYYKKGQVLDHFRLVQLCEEYNVVSLIGQDYLNSIANAYSFLINLDEQIEVLLELSSKRKLNEMITQAQKTLNSKDQSESIDLINMFQKGFDNISQGRKISDNVVLSDVINDLEIEIEELSKNDGKTTGVKTHLTHLDEKTAGLQAGDLIILAARPSMGKTAFSLTLINNMIQENKKAMIFSLEMDAKSLLKRMLSMDSLIPLERIRSGDFDANHWISYQSSIEKMKSWHDGNNLIINDRPGISVEEIHAYAKNAAKTSGLDIIFVDYLQLATTKNKSESRTQEVSEISRKLKEIARDLKVPVVALSQLSRAVEQRQNKRPMLSDLRESGAIEQDADVILFLYRDKYYNKEIDDDTTEVIIGKQRNGPTDTVRVVFQQERTMFVDLKNPY